MNKLFVRYFFLIPLFFANQTFAWTIEEFNLFADIQADGTVQIKETIQADFTNETYKHGIFRDIPAEYKDENGKTFKTPIQNITVTDVDGNRRNFTQSMEGSHLSLKIGDADKTVSEKETYVIKYTVSGVINAFEEHDEFFWNVTGNQWDSPIEKVAVVVGIPEVSNTYPMECFTGTEGSTEQNCSSQLGESMDIAFFRTTEPLAVGEGFTIVFGWDKGLVAIPERIYTFDFQYWAKRLQYLFLFFPLWATYRNFRIRKELKPQKALIPLYHPPENMGVGLIGFFDRGKSNTRDLTAVLTQLCVKGILKIKEIPASGAFGKESYEFTVLKAPDLPLDKEEQYVYDHLTLPPGKSATLKELTKASGSIFKYGQYQGLVNQIRLEVSHYFRNSSVTPLKFLGLTFVFFWAFFFGIVGSAIANSLIPTLSLVGGIIALVALPMFGAKGQALKHDVEGYKLFLTTADKDRINWREAQNIFEKNLPYAIALDLTDKWAQVFGDKIQPPEWYESPNNSMNFGQLQRNITTSAASSITRSTPRTTSSSSGSSGFGGGGSSGGGFGGGGGRSW